MLRRFDALRDHFQLEVVRQVDHGRHQLAVFFATFHTANEAFINLEQGDRQAVEVHKGRKSGAEVVQREAHAQASQCIHRLLDQVAAPHHGGLGQLKFQPLRFNPALGDQAAEGGEQLAVLKLAKRQVDRHVQRRQPAFAQGLHVTQCARNHPVTQGHDQPALLGQRYKFAGGQQAALAVTPAHQRFEADNLPAGQVQARLVVQFQFVTAQRPAQLAFEIGQAACVAIDALIEQVIRAALGAFGLLHGDVCVPHQRVSPGVGPSVGDAQTATNQQAFAVDPIRFGQRFGDALSDQFSAFGGAASVDQQRKLVAAQSCQLIARL